MNTVQEAKMLGFATYMPAVLPRSVDSYNETYELNRHRVYALAFWMTDNELDAAQLENRFGAIIRAGQRLGQGKNLRLGQDTPQRLQPTVALVRSGKE